jgi:hypothetical protein
MESIRAGKAGDTILSFYPTPSHIGRPSYMELNMASGLLGGFKAAVDFLCKNSQGIDNKLYKRIFDALLTLMELHASLESATVGERYLGLVRVRRDGTSMLKWHEKLSTLFEATALPFLIDKYEKEERSKPFVSAFKSVQAIFGLVYLSGFSNYSSVLHFLAGIRIVRKRSYERVPSRLNRILSSLIHGFVYSVQLAQWYYSHESILNAAQKHKNINPPPRAWTGLADPRYCPICRNLRKNPTALLTTGQVFCYMCISSFLQHKHPQEDHTKLIRRLVDGS